MASADSLSYVAALDGYQRQADALFDALQSGSGDARWRFKWEHPRFRGKSVAEVDPAMLGSSDAQLVIAHQHGFETWADVVAFTEAVTRDGAVARFEAAVEAVISGDLTALRSMLRDHPDLARARSTRRHHATLLHYLGANGVEGGRQKTPPNAVDVAKTLLDAGAEVDALADLKKPRMNTFAELRCEERHEGRAAIVSVRDRKTCRTERTPSKRNGPTKRNHIHHNNCLSDFGSGWTR